MSQPFDSTGVHRAFVAVAIHTCPVSTLVAQCSNALPNMHTFLLVQTWPQHTYTRTDVTAPADTRPAVPKKYKCDQPTPEIKVEEESVLQQ